MEEVKEAKMLPKLLLVTVSEPAASVATPVNGQVVLEYPVGYGLVQLVPPFIE
jgi:hypothetical protein